MLTFTVERQDVEAVRALLDTFPVTYTVHRRWIFWRQFRVSGEVSGVAESVQRLKSSLWFGRLERSDKTELLRLNKLDSKKPAVGERVAGEDGHIGPVLSDRIGHSGPGVTHRGS